jgi:biotin carboxyl carrier protein
VSRCACRRTPKGEPFLARTMKLRAEIAGADHSLEFRRDGSRVIATIDGRQYELQAHDVEPGVYLLHLGARVYECRVRNVDAAAGVNEVHVGQEEFQVTLIDPRRLSHAAMAGTLAAGRAAVIAPMPGRVVRVLVELGAQVEAGAGLIVVEAMKMQNELKSPKAGLVTSLNAETGAAVNAGDTLVVIE